MHFLQRTAWRSWSRAGWPPFVSEAPRELVVGPEGGFAIAPFSLGGGARSLRRDEELRNTYAFKMPVGSTVVAAREGRVARAGSSFLAVVHEDGSFAGYWPLGEIMVEVGREVKAGDRLGATGKLDRPGVHSGAGAEPQLDFGVFVGKEGGGMRSLQVRFEDGSEEGLSPVTGLSYGGGAGASGS